MAEHIITGDGAPVNAPAGIGHHYIDTTGGVAYISIGTASSADWLNVSGGGGGGDPAAGIMTFNDIAATDQGAGVWLVDLTAQTSGGAFIVTNSSGITSAMNIDLPDTSGLGANEGLRFILEGINTNGASVQLKPFGSTYKSAGNECQGIFGDWAEVMFLGNIGSLPGGDVSSFSIEVTWNKNTWHVDIRTCQNTCA